MRHISTRKLSGQALLLVAASMLSASSLAGGEKNPIQSRDSIRETARHYALQLVSQGTGNENIKIDVASLDKRLRLARCSEPLSAFESPNTRNVGRTTIGVRCDGDKSWKLYVPVDIQVIKNVVSLKQPVTRNSVLQASDLKLVEKNVASLHQGYFTSIEALAGKNAKNAMQAGTILSPAQVKNPMAIKKGALVTILADIGGIQVRMKGKAMKSGALGDWISVKNISSKRQVEGRVTGSGVIQVTL